MRKLAILLCLWVSVGWAAKVTKPTHVTIADLPIPAYNNVRTNWQNAGLLTLGGIPNRTTQCGATVNPSGLTPPVANDDVSLINTAITNCTAGQVVQLGSGTFQIAQSEQILLNKSITLRGTGTCNNASSPYCATVINSPNGALSDWSISSTQAGAQCGTSPASFTGCSGSALLLISPSGNFNWGWAGCNLGTAVTSCGATLAADVAQGATQVQVSSTTNFSVGGWVLIDEDPQLTPINNPINTGTINGTADFLNSSGSPATMRFLNVDSSNTYSMASSRLGQEIHLVTAIGAGPCPGVNCTLTFDDPVTIAFRQSGSHDARVFWPTVQGSTANPFLAQAGVENLTITRPGNGGIQMTFCAYCWVKNVEVGNWIHGAVNVSYSARDQIEFNYFHDCYDCENNGVEYPMGIDSASTEVYAVNNIIVRGGKGMVGRASNTAVIAYNYVDDTFYMQAVVADNWMDMSLNGSHFSGTHHWLLEGNLADNCDGDETHGPASYHVFFRNHCKGVRASFTDPSQGKTVDDASNTCWGTGGGANPPAANCAPLRAAGPMGMNYWYAYVGNVLGLTGVTTTGNSWAYAGAFVGGGTPPACSNKCLWMSGWVGGEGTHQDANLTGAGAFIFQHGNYDYVNAGINDWTAGYSHNLPNSFYLTAKPAFFNAGSCTYPWPWVSSTAGNVLLTNSCSGSGLPAKARFDAGTPFVQP